MAKSVRIDEYGNVLNEQGDVLWYQHDGRASKLREWLNALGVYDGRQGACTLTFTPDATPEEEGGAVDALLAKLERTEIWGDHPLVASARAEYERMKREGDIDAEGLRDALADNEELRHDIGDLSRLADRRRKELEGERVVNFYGHGPTAGMEPGPYYVRHIEAEEEKAKVVRPVPYEVRRGKLVVSPETKWRCSECGYGLLRLDGINLDLSDTTAADQWKACPNCDTPLDWSDLPGGE